jgi:GDP-4-dehydro-6-deoxy-D-mannose reductase
MPLGVRSDPALRRAVDVERIVGSHERATRDTGWTPRISLDETLGVLLDDWRQRLAAES